MTTDGRKVIAIAQLYSGRVSEEKLARQNIHV
jgi:hypothetical protein